MGRYVINFLASRDLNEIADYFAENSLEAGEQFFCSFNRECQQLVFSGFHGNWFEKIPLL